MKYKFFGKKIPHIGKPLWEYLGNLNNFGVGRLFVRSTTLKHPEPSFFKIVKVQPLPSPDSQFEDRNVMVWVEEVYRGVKSKDVVLMKDNFMPDYILIPKVEEDKYFKLAEEYADKDTFTVIPKYTPWPPLFEMVWKSRNKGQELNKLNTVLPSTVEHSRIGDAEEMIQNSSSSLYTQNVPVEDMIKEIVRLQKIVNAHAEGK